MSVAPAALCLLLLLGLAGGPARACEPEACPEPAASAPADNADKPDNAVKADKADTADRADKADTVDNADSVGNADSVEKADSVDQADDGADAAARRPAFVVDEGFNEIAATDGDDPRLVAALAGYAARADAFAQQGGPMVEAEEPPRQAEARLAPSMPVFAAGAALVLLMLGCAAAIGRQRTRAPQPAAGGGRALRAPRASGPFRVSAGRSPASG